MIPVKKDSEYTPMDLRLYAVVFVVVYLGTMFLKYIAGITMDWLVTFLLFFGISVVYLLLRSTGEKRNE
ncbi:hypothetical protein J2Z83_003053 [Virgibacillus natechei]|uniref:Uncharacterized protein n=1 Tax=Virgibacillus natechei TaxID=1216297 RepID=A0ABS4IJ07_9BACI|nr:hypothetical protein [Virgibacillus natechei]MBP1970917.1 hypothetical protein [Virgibacillus natechei]UZD13299.1 hypothetical protein OLD84_01655 [Virgibacillus natechei]